MSRERFKRFLDGQRRAYAEGGWVDDGYDAMGNRTGVAEGTGVPLEVQAIGGALQHANNQFSKSIGAMTAPDDTYNGGLPGHLIKGTIEELGDLGTLGRDSWNGTFDPRSDEGIDRVTRGALTMAGTAYGMGPEGSLGMFVGRNSKKFPVGKATEARDLLNGGFTEPEIWERTGIGYNRKDQSPMAEISDHKAALNTPEPDFAKPKRADYPDVHSYLAAGDKWRMAGGREAPTMYRMADVLDHPELFEHYPDLADMPLRLRKDMADGHRGSYIPDPVNPRIELNSNVPAMNQLETILHELQHAVQHKEGWQGGTNMDAAKSLVGSANRRIEAWENLLSIKELKAAGLSDEQIAKMGADGKLVDGSPTAIQRADALPQDVIEQHLNNSYMNKRPYTRSQPTETDEFATYQRHDGEVQARNVQNRQAMDDEQRRAAFWKDTEDRQGEPRLLSSEYGQGISASVDSPGLKGGDHPDLISPRMPTAKKPVADPFTNYLDADTNAMRLDPEGFQHNIGLLRDYPMIPREIARDGTTEDVAKAYQDISRQNLLFLHDEVPQAIRGRSQLWYDGANRIAQDRAQQYGLPPSSVAGVYAALSPQKDWFQNVSLGDRVLDIVHNAKGPFTPEMETTARRLFSKPEQQPIIDALRGRSLHELESPEEKALWLRAYDQTHNSPNYRVVSPEGDYQDFATNKGGERSRAAWGSLGEIGKAISSIEAKGDMGALSRLMGERHKVRSFFDNIAAPNSRAGALTADTHAVAANQLRPLSGTSTEVAQNFKNSVEKGAVPAKGSAVTGAQGTYGINADPYRQAAAERDLLPRQMQSITWEGLRGLMSPEFKSAPKNAKVIDDIWRQYANGEIPLVQAQRLIHDYAGGIRPPEWYR